MPRGQSELEADIAQTEQEAADPAIQRGREQLAIARERMLSAALAFCDGTISAGQLRAVREFLREKDSHLAKLEGATPPVFVEDPPAQAEVGLIGEETLTDRSIKETLRLELETEDAPELMEMLTALDEKLDRLEDDFEHGRINASQYRAIRRHYQEQREVALRLKQAHPRSDRWRVVLEEGRTTFLMQLNEAQCTCVALFDLNSRDRIFLQGDMPPAAEEAMGLLRTFGPPRKESGPGRMLATHLDDASCLLLIPGHFTAVLAIFSQDPPGWQVRALKEVLLNFEAANRTGLRKSQHEKLVFPDLRRFVKS
ncbi:MAG TPA: hypothetical protein VI520_04945 [Anaerolineales bacterium]|nr:hypothetical protein [Anaerolineales bacterium]